MNFWTFCSVAMISIAFMQTSEAGHGKTPEKHLVEVHNAYLDIDPKIVDQIQRIEEKLDKLLRKQPNLDWATLENISALGYPCDRYDTIPPRGNLWLEDDHEKPTGK